MEPLNKPIHSEVELAVYYDPNFPSSWISHGRAYPKKIADFFSNNGVQLLDANQLRDFILAAINDKSAHRKLIIFSQDVVPNTVVENYYSTTTLREYLDAGGSILWIGDIPLYYVGKPEKKAELVAKHGTPTNMLGIIPVFATPKTTVRIKAVGRRTGLRSKWSGTRPILKDQGLTILAQSESVVCRYYLDLERKKNLLARFWDWIRTIQSFKAADFEVSFGKSKAARELKTKIHVHETHPNAWLKCFNDYYPKCGFYRIWDYEPRNLTDNMVKELFKIAKSISRRIGRMSRIFWLSREDRNT